MQVMGFFTRPGMKKTLFFRKRGFMFLEYLLHYIAVGGEERCWV